MKMEIVRRAFGSWEKIELLSGEESIGELEVDETGYIAGFYIKEAYREKGYGTALLEAAVSYCNKELHRTPKLDCAHHKYDFYVKRGFVALKPLKNTCANFSIESNACQQCNTYKQAGLLCANFQPNQYSMIRLHYREAQCKLKSSMGFILSHR